MKKSKTGLEVDPERNLLDASLSSRRYNKICLVTKGPWKQGNPVQVLNHARKAVRSEWPFLRQVKETAIDKDTLVLSISRREGKVIDDWYMDNGSFGKDATLYRTEYHLYDGARSLGSSWARAYYMETASRLSDDEQEAPCLVKLLRMVTGETGSPNLFQETQTWKLKTDWSRYFLLYSRSEWQTEKRQVYVE